MSSPRKPPSTEPPAVDRRLVAVENRYEIDDGELVYVPPADEPHAVSHGALGALLRAHRAPDRSVAIDMLTRTSETSDIAPDASIYPSERDDRTGGRRLEELAFELMASERRSETAGKARKLVERGVRHVFAIDVTRKRAFEWSSELGDWSILATTSVIDDAALAVPLPIEAIVDAAKADLATVRAYRAQRHPEFLAEREAGRIEGHEAGRVEGHEAGRVEGLRIALRGIMTTKFGTLNAAADATIATADASTLEGWLARVMSVGSVDDLLGC